MVRTGQNGLDTLLSKKEVKYLVDCLFDLPAADSDLYA